MNPPSTSFQNLAKKSPAEFTGKGAEIIGHPSKGGGELWYVDGHCTQIGCESLPFDPATALHALLNITPAQHVAWFTLSRKYHLKRKASVLLYVPVKNQDVDDRKRANELSAYFTEAMLEGRLSAFVNQVATAESTEKREAQRNEDDKEPIDGFRNAIFAIAFKCTHPNQVTVSSVIDYLRAHPEVAGKYSINDSILTPRTVRRHLKNLGFSWLEDGRKQGRPKK